MSEKMRGELETARIRGKRTWLAVILAFLGITGAFIFLHLNSPNVEERLATINADRAIPDSQNAAVIYNLLLEDPNVASLGYLPEFIDVNSDGQTLLQPWLEKDYPEVAAWIEEYRWLIDKLIEASHFEKCHFPLVADWYDSTRSTQLSIVRRWAFLIKRASNNDIAENRNEDAIAKCKCLIRMGEHFRQQSMLIEYLNGIAIESLGLNQMIVLIMEGNIDESHLQEIELILMRTRNNWVTAMDRIEHVEELVQWKFKEQLGLIGRLKYKLRYGLFGKKRKYKEVRFISNRILTSKRGIHILMALKRYKNKYSKWPKDLDEIKSMVVEHILVDPLSSRSFVYKLTNDGFILYSKGKNNLDEGGRKKDGADDWPIWLPRQ